MMYGEATKRAPREGEIYRARPRFEADYVLTTRTDIQDMTDPANVAQVLRETAADADELRDTLKDWIDGQYGIAENENGELETLRVLIGNMGIVMGNAAHVLAKCAARPENDTRDGIPYDEPPIDRVPYAYEMNAAECLEVMERACGSSNDTELCDTVLCGIRDIRKALGLPNDSGAGVTF